MFPFTLKTNTILDFFWVTNWFDSTGGLFKSAKQIVTLPLTFLAQVSAKLPNVLDGLKATLVQLLAADPLIKLPDTIDSM